MKKILLAGVITTSLIFSSVPVVFADEVKATQPSNQIQVLGASESVGMNLGKEFREAVKRALVKDIDVKTVESLSAKGYGYYKIALISALSQKSGKSIDIVINALKEPIKLTQTLGLKAEDIKSITKDIKEKRVQIQKEYIEKAKQEHARLVEQKKKHLKNFKSAAQDKAEIKKEIKKDNRQLKKIEKFKKEIKKDKKKLDIICKKLKKRD